MISTCILPVYKVLVTYMLNELNTLVPFLQMRTPTTIDNSDKYFPKVRSTK